MKTTLSTRDILAALQLPKVGPSTVRRLWSTAGSEGGPALVEQIEALQGKRGVQLSTSQVKDAYSRADHILERSEKRGIVALSPADTAYPVALLDLPDYPPVIYLRGSLTTLAKPKKLAVVGTREASELGLKLARKIAAELSNLDICVVSGLARGIDTAAHEGAVRGKGSTIAVLAHGLDQIAPKSNEELADSILTNNGVLLSEHEVGVIPRAAQFVARNRLQSGLSKGSIVVESGFTGGSIYQGKFTAEQKRLLFVVMPDASLPGAEHFRRDGGERLHKEYGARKISRLGDIANAIPEFGLSASERLEVEQRSVPIVTRDVGANVREEIAVADRYDATVKSSIAIHHLSAAQLFARNAEALEGSADQSAEIASEIRSYTLGAVLTAVAFLEAMINDIYLAAVDGPPNSPFSDFIQTDAVANVWRTANHSRWSLIEKYDRALEASGRPRYTSSDPVRTNAEHLIYLRNSIVHYQPEWDNDLRRHKAVEERLSGRFPENRLADRRQAFFPHRCLGAGCARWSVTSAMEFATDVSAKLGLSDTIRIGQAKVRKKIA